MAVGYVELAVGALFGGGLTFLAAQRKLRTEAVTAERTKWREKMRQIAADVFAGGHRDVWVRVAINTNPGKGDDVLLVQAVRRLGDRRPTDWEADEIAARFALLLKHDWERAKREASWWPFDTNLGLWKRKAIRRDPYEGPIYPIH